MDKCMRCKKGRLKVIATGYYGNSLIVHCQNPQCDIISETEITTNMPGTPDSELESEE